LNKLHPLNSYDGNADPDEHIKNIKAILDYKNVQEEMTIRYLSPL